MSLERIVKKHVVLSMSNGCVLEGFVERVEGAYFTLIETNNQEVIVKKDDISFVRIGSAQQMFTATIEEPIESFNSPPQEEYSIPLPRPTDGPYVRQPEFARRSSNK